MKRVMTFAALTIGLAVSWLPATQAADKKPNKTIDDETIAATKEFITRQAKAGQPFFVWWNGTRMHFRTHVKAEHRGISGQDEYSDGMVEHDMHVGELLKVIDDLGLANAAPSRIRQLRRRPADAGVDDRRERCAVRAYCASYGRRSACFHSNGRTESWRSGVTLGQGVTWTL